MGTRRRPTIAKRAKPPQFAGLPARTLLEAGTLPVAELAALALREGQCTSPLYRVHRWFARRLGTQFRSMLAALTLAQGAATEEFWDRYRGHIPLDGAVVLDPFVGGGTSLVEASRCGARVIGYDIDPVATHITRFELGCATLEGLPSEAVEVCAAVSTRLARFHWTDIGGDCRQAEVLHHFWVELRRCTGCGHEFEVHPHFQLAYDTKAGRQWAFCRSCHAVRELPLSRKRLVCECGETTRIEDGPLDRGTVTCPACRLATDLCERSDHAGPPHWRLFAQEYVVHNGRQVTRLFKAASETDRTLCREAERELEHLDTLAPGRHIPVEGRADRRPLLHGFRRYRELFNPRQLLHLTLLGRAVLAVRDQAARRLLATAFSEHLTTNCMYAAYAFGYRRISPLFSIHSYRHITRPVELNPWLDGIGRGTFPNVLGKIRKAIAFARQPSDLVPGDGRHAGGRQVGPADGKVSDEPGVVVRGERGAAVVTGSSADLGALDDASVDLILTDPPYFDNLSYSELSDFYLAWHQALGVAESPYDDGRRHAPITANLAVRRRGEEAATEYRDRLGAIFRECRRVLKPKGVCVFTYHHRSAEAWLALGEALARSGLRCAGVVPLRGEGQGGLHNYDGTIKWDAVLVCRRRPLPASTAPVVLTEHDMAAALTAVRGATERLGDARLGFRDPDRLNLYRAGLAARATVAPLAKGHILLSTALQSEPAL
jgi:adenine-specific DNA methylase